MNIPPHRIEEYKRLVYQEKGIVLDDKTAKRDAAQFLRLLKHLLQPKENIANIESK